MGLNQGAQKEQVNSLRMMPDLIFNCSTIILVEDKQNTNVQYACMVCSNYIIMMIKQTQVTHNHQVYILSIDMFFPYFHSPYQQT